MTNVFLLGCMGPVHLPISSEVVVYVDCRGWQQMKHSSKREKKQNRIRYLNNYVTIGRNRARGLSRKYSNSECSLFAKPLSAHFWLNLLIEVPYCCRWNIAGENVKNPLYNRR